MKTKEGGEQAHKKMLLLVEVLLGLDIQTLQVYPMQILHAVVI